MTEYYYRYDSNWDTSRTVRLYLSKYKVLKHTPKGVWVDDYGQKRFVLTDARKRFACPTEEEALTSFRARKARQIRILKSQLQHAELALKAEPGKPTYAWTGVFNTA